MADHTLAHILYETAPLIVAVGIAVGLIVYRKAKLSHAKD